MTSSRRVRLIPLVLVALASLLPAAAGAQNPCCSCHGNGTNCSACFYVVQAARCGGYRTGSIRYCGCASEAIGGGGGCTRLSSRTTVMGLDRGTDREAKLAGQQLGVGLLNPGERREGSFNFEEWALVSSAGGVLGASTVEFANRVQSAAERFRPRGKGTSTVLVIEDAEPRDNGREIPVPGVAPIDIDAGLAASVAGQETWFRAEVGEDGMIDQVSFLNLPDELASGSNNERLHERLREKLSLRYAGESRHRVVVFGLLRANLEGHLVMTRSQVILPKSCCHGRHCV